MVNNTEAKTEIQKIKDDVESIQEMIRDLEARKGDHMLPTEGAALLGVIARERARLTPLLLKLDKEESAREEKYLVTPQAQKQIETPREVTFDEAQDSDYGVSKPEGRARQSEAFRKSHGIQ